MKKFALFAIIAAGFLFASFLFENFISFQPTYVIITVDVERDVVPYLQSYKGIEEGIPKLLETFDKYDVKATFFVVGETAEKYPQVLLNLKGRGHEIGLHGLEHERFDELNHSEKERRVQKATVIIENITKEKVVSFRAPYHSSDTDTLNILEKSGYITEASASLRAYPYFPSKYNWFENGNMSILRLPVSHTPFLFYPSSFYNKSWVEGYNFVISSQIDKKIKVIVIGMHPWEFVEMPEVKEAEEYTRVAGEQSLNKLKELLEYLKDKNIKYVTAKEFYEIFRSVVL